MKQTQKIQELGEKQVATYWWNFGKKTNDFRGSLNELLKKWNVKVSEVKHPIQKDISGIRFKCPVGSSVITFDTFDCNYHDAAIQAIKLCLTYLGDKSLLIDGYGRERRVNH